MKVLFPTDFSETSTQAMTAAVDIARAYGAELVILHVIDPPEYILKIVSGYNEELAIRTARKKLDEFISLHADAGIQMSRMVKTGKPFRKISEAADEIDPVAIVMGTQGMAEAKSQFLGSNTERVLKLAKCPVIAIPNEFNQKVTERILLPLDLTRSVKEKVNFGLEVAKQFESELYIVSILPENDPELDDMESKLNTILDMCKNKGIQASGEIISPVDLPGEGILNYAAEKNVGMICIMTQREHNIRDMILGSTASFLMANSEIPVMAIRPKTIYLAKRPGSIFG